MTKMPWWKRALMVLGASVATLAALAGQPRPGHSAEPPGPPQAADGTAFMYLGSGECKRCHAETKESAIRNSPTSVGFIKLDEYTTWMSLDKHSLAYKRLTTDRGTQIADRLKKNVTLAETGCLGCHSASVEEKTKRAKAGDQFDLTEGVSCENCHGPYSAWDTPHRQLSFRDYTPQKKASLGFNDLRPPDKQAEKCLSCHIGNVDEGKVVTHQMYAAGHPPLPSIEVATFTNSIPRHWWLLGERRDPKLRQQLKFEEGQLEQTKLAIVGAAVALKTSLKLVAREAVAPNPSVPGEEWPDYARFDCWSCHHDLKRESWRQARGFKGGPPGRVPVAEWPLALVELGIDRVAIDDAQGAATLRHDLKQRQEALLAQANARPFGRKELISKAADEFAGWLDVLIPKLTAAKYDKGVAKTLLRTLVENAEQSTRIPVEKPEQPFPDYDAARHIAWTIKLLTEELGDDLPKKEAVLAVVDKLDKGLKLKLPAGTEYEIEDQLGPALQVIGDYDPAQFHQNLQELAALLKPEK